MRIEDIGKRNNENENEQKKQDLPENVLNKEQDPDSLKDPLIIELEKSKQQNSSYENRKLEELKKTEKE